MSESIKYIVILLVIELVLAMTVPAYADDSFYDIQAPGQRIDMGGYKLHINCQNNGSPTVILDAGLGDWSTHWTSVQKLLQNSTRVCSYDRAGYGWSDPGPRPRYSGRAVEELHSLLDKAKVEPPYILVGHSLGGLNMRLFASRYPDEVKGLVLVDASHPASLSGKHDSGNPNSTAAPATSNQMILVQPANIDELKFPPEAQAAMHDNLLHTKSVVTGRAEFRGMGLSAAEITKTPTLPDIPLIVITRGQRVWPPGIEGDAQEAAWQAQQAELSKLTTSGSQRIASHSGHHIHLDEPEVVADAVRELIRIK